MSFLTPMNEIERQAVSQGASGMGSSVEESLPLTGRSTEVSLLQDRWEQAQEGMGQVVLLIGEPGLGKSRLVKTIKQSVQSERSAGSIVEWQCSHSFQNTGLYPVADYLRRFLELERESSSAARFDRLASYLDQCALGTADLVTLFAKLLFLPIDERYTAANLTPIREREETFRAIRQWLRGLSERGPLLFIVEDLHWIDASTLQFLGEFIGEGLHDRILTLLTFRPEFKTPWPSMAHQTSLALNRLSRRQVGSLIGGGASVPESLAAEIFERTRGVPLLVEEFARLLLESEAGGGAGAGEMQKITGLPLVPATLPELILRRMDRLQIRRDVAQVAAVFGREFSCAIIEAVADIESATLAPEIEKLVCAGILRANRLAPEALYSFKHALVEEALLGSLDLTEKQRIHRQIATRIESWFPELGEQQPELLATHFTEAGSVQKAISYRLKSGLLSRAKFANIEAISHFKEGLTLLEMLEANPNREARELELLGPLGTAYIASYGYASPEVGPIFERAQALCEQAGETPQIFGTMWGNFAYHIVKGDFPLCATLAERAIAFGERLGDAGILMEAQFLKGITHFYRGEFSSAYTHLSHSLDYEGECLNLDSWRNVIGEDPRITIRCYLALTHWQLGYPDHALELARETMALARNIDHPFSVEYSLHHAGWLFQLCRLGADAAAAGAEQMRIAKEQGFSFWHATGKMFRAAGLLLQGEDEEGLPMLEKGLEAYRQTGAELGLPHYLAMLTEAYIGMGKLVEARRALNEAFDFVAKNDERWHAAELERLKAELVLAESAGDSLAEASFSKAMSMARHQRSRAWELRAATSIARLWQRNKRTAAALEVIEPVYDHFDEGFETPDLRRAALLLDELRTEGLRQEFAAGLEYVRNCLPKPLTGSIVADYRYLPASTLGGDTLGYHWLDERNLAIYLIDVTGHGLGSALLSVSISNLLRSGAAGAVDMRRPDQVLEILNSTFQGRQHAGRYFTIWYGVYDASSQILTWAGGGHHPAVLVDPCAPEPVLLASTGPMMGVFNEAKFTASSREVTLGSRLLIFSDGVFEIRQDEEMMWDFPGCVALLASISRGGQSVMDELLQHARTLRGSQHLDDDFSIIEVRFERPASEGKTKV